MALFIKYPCPKCRYDVANEPKCPECGSDWDLSVFGVLPGLSARALLIKWYSAIVGILVVPALVALLTNLIDGDEWYWSITSSILLVVMSLLGICFLQCVKGVRSPHRVTLFIAVSNGLHASGLVLFPLAVSLSLAGVQQLAAWTTVLLVVWVGCLAAGSILLAILFDDLHYNKNYKKFGLVRLVPTVCVYLFAAFLCGILLHNPYWLVFSVCMLPILFVYAKVLNAIHAEMDRRGLFSRF